MSAKIDWNKPIELVETHSGVVLPTAEPTEYIGPAVGQPHYSNAVRAWGKVYLVSATGGIQNIPDFHIRNVREPQYRPYSPDELAALVGTAVRCNSTGDECVVACHCRTSQRVYMWWKFDIEERSCSDILLGYTHLDGTPCGVLEEGKE